MARAARTATGRLEMLSETFIVALGVSLLSLPVVTVLPALAAGARHLARHADHGTDTLRDLWADFREAVRGVWPLGLASVALASVLVLNLRLVATGGLPGATLVGVVSGVALAAEVVVALRSAASWRPGARWPGAVRAAARHAVVDLRGSALLLVAAGTCAVIVWMYAPLVVLVPGLLVLAAIAVERRRPVPR